MRGATRVEVAQVPELIGVLVEGLADAAVAAPAEAPPAPQSLVSHLRTWWRGRGHRADVVAPPGSGRRTFRRRA